MNKQIILDGGPADGQVVVVESDTKVYECYEQPKMDKGAKDNPIPPPIKHIYKEDPRVEGHFIYIGDAFNSIYLSILL
jgi:hypothetical protein